MREESESSKVWEVEVRSGSVADGHGPLGAFYGRRVLRQEPSAPALVLGSGQRVDDGLEARAALSGLPVVRRNSGGGAVLVVPGQVLWVDVLVPRGDLLWDDDVGRSSAWLGATWVDALAGVGEAAEVVAAASGAPIGRAVCFAGRTTGEVLVGGRKVVGVSQRRDRFGARFQCAALVGFDAVESTVVPLVDLLGLGSSKGSGGSPVDEVRRVVGGVDASVDDLFAAFLASLVNCAR